MMKIIILGGHGFVGKNVGKILQSTRHDVYSLSRKDGLDLTVYDSILEFLNDLKPDCIINCAAKVGSLNYVSEQAAEIIDINTRMILNIYKSLKETLPGCLLINPIANCVFPGHLEKFSENLLWSGPLHQSVLSYGATRRILLAADKCYQMQYGLRSINFFVPNMYGPYDSTDPNKAHALNALVNKVVKAKIEGEESINVWGSGIAIREWLYAEDFGRVIIETFNRDDNYLFSNPINIGQNYGLSIRSILDIIIEEVGYKGAIHWDQSMPDGAPIKVMDDVKFRKVFPDFEFTDLRKGVRKTIEYYQSLDFN